MLASKKILKRLMKKTFKNEGLVIGFDNEAETNNDYLFISGTYWTIWIHTEFIPKEIKAAIYELTGEFPLHSEVIQCTTESNERVIPTDRKYDLSHNKKKVTIPYSQTRLYQAQGSTMLNFLQSQDKKVAAVNSIFTEMISEGHKDIDHNNGEVDPVGPLAAIEGTAIMWMNNVSALKIYPHYPQTFTNDEELWKHLEGINIELDQ